MRLLFLNGGLANQVFQYLFYRYASLRHPEETWVLDDSFFFVHNVHNGYELESVFGLAPALLSRTFDRDVWEYMIRLKKNEGLSIPEILRREGEDVLMIAETANWQEWNPFSGQVTQITPNAYLPEILDLPAGLVYYHGYWINRSYFAEHEALFLKELAFPEITEAYNLEYAREMRDAPSCAVHVRRGDYVTLGRAFPDEHYRVLIQKLLSEVPDAVFFVFSDDLAYCKEHAERLGLTLGARIVYVEGNRGASSFRDMQLMTLCKHMILTDSAFSYLAALLNRNDGVIVNPTSRKVGQKDADASRADSAAT